MKFLKPVSFILALGLISCCASKNSTEGSASEQSKIESDMNSKKTMIDKGYSEGVIIASETAGDCPFVIKINDENYPYLLDPINLTEEFKTDAQEIWFTFSGLRMPNRCENANPISIIEIIKKEE